MKLGPCYFTPISHKSHTKFALSWVGAHTDPTLTVLHAWWEISRRLYGLWVLGLTQIPRISRFCTPGGKSHGDFTVCGFLGSHRSHGSHGFARLVENLTDDSWALLQWVKEKKSEYSERSEYSEFCMVEGLGFV